MDFIQKLLSGLVDSFKMKNPVVFTVVALALGVVYFGINAALGSSLPDGTALINDSTTGLLEKVQSVLVVVMALLGAHTPQSKLKS